MHSLSKSELVVSSDLPHRSGDHSAADALFQIQRCAGVGLHIVQSRPRTAGQNWLRRGGIDRRGATARSAFHVARRCTCAWCDRRGDHEPSHGAGHCGDERWRIAIRTGTRGCDLLNDPAFHPSARAADHRREIVNETLILRGMIEDLRQGETLFGG